MVENTQQLGMCITPKDAAPVLGSVAGRLNSHTYAWGLLARLR